MLLYLCDRGFHGHPEELTEQQIGIAVFGRPAAYDSANDNVVRVAARQLRIKLQEYYDTEGRSDQEILFIPKGAYVPEIVPRENDAVSSERVPETNVPAKAGQRNPAWRAFRPWWISTAASVIAVLATGATGTAAFARSGQGADTAVAGSRQKTLLFWDTWFLEHQDNVELCPGRATARQS